MPQCVTSRHRRSQHTEGLSGLTLGQDDAVVAFESVTERTASCGPTRCRHTHHEHATNRRVGHARYQATSSGRGMRLHARAHARYICICVRLHFERSGMRILIHSSTRAPTLSLLVRTHPNTRTHQRMRKHRHANTHTRAHTSFRKLVRKIPLAYDHLHAPWHKRGALAVSIPPRWSELLTCCCYCCPYAYGRAVKSWRDRSCMSR